MESLKQNRNHRRSAHLLDLSAETARKTEPVGRSRRRRPGIFWRLRRAGCPDDSRLSCHPQGWRDFPDRRAETIGQAVRILVIRFFREHPRSELKVPTVVQLAADVVSAGAAPKKAIRTDWRPAAMAFTTACLLIFSTLAYGPQAADWGKGQAGEIMMVAKAGAFRLLMAGEAAAAGNVDRAKSDFRTAAEDFRDIRSGLGRLGMALLNGAALLPINSEVAAAGPLLAAGESLAQAGAALAEATAALDRKDTLGKIVILQEALSKVKPHLESAGSAIAQIRAEALPERYRSAVLSARAEMPRLSEELRRAEDALSLLRWLSGEDSFRRILFAFQNDAEIRATGGFIGSFAVIDVDRGRIVRMDIPGGGSYDLQGSLQARLISPQPLRLIRAGWEFQDSNWFADFPASAAKMAWFLERSGGPTADGVIVLNASLIESVLEITGPIEMPEYGKTVTGDNFWILTQTQVEIDYDREENRPKQFIADLAPKLISRLTEADRSSLFRLLPALISAMEEKDAMVWFRDEEAQALADRLDWTGRIKGHAGDYLAVVHTNIAGQKTDRHMKDSLTREVSLGSDGSATVAMTLKRTHTGLKGDLFTGVRNVDYVRILVPAGAELIRAAGFDAPDPKLFKIPEPDRRSDPDIQAIEATAAVDPASGVRTFAEAGKTAFGGWIQTDPGQSSEVTVIYRLPSGTVGGGYSLLVQKQSGAGPMSLSVTVRAPSGMIFPNGSGEWASETEIIRDTVLEAEWQKNETSRL